MDDENDVKGLLERGYDAPPPDERFTEDLLDRMKRELRASRNTALGVEAPPVPEALPPLARPLPSPWRWVALAASILAVVGAGALALHWLAPPPLPHDPDTMPQVQGTPGETPHQPPAPGAEPGPAGAANGKLAPLAIKLPTARVIGTPRHIPQRPTLELYKEKREPFLAPEGTTNLARGKPVTASDKEPIIGDLKMVTDGNKEAGEDTFVELGPGVQWVRIDLGETCRLYAVAIWHFHMEMRVYHDVVVQVADDPDFIRGVQTVFNDDFDNSSGLGVGKDLEYIDNWLGKLIDAKGVLGRYVRIYSKGNTSNDQNHYVEVEVYGKPVAASEGAAASR